MLDCATLRSKFAQKRALVIGGLNVDLHFSYEREPSDDGCESVLNLSTAFGGHAGNCAVALRKLGIETWVLGSVGNDAEGRSLLDDLSLHGIRTNLVFLDSQKTGTVLVSTSFSRQSMFMYRGANDSLHIANALKTIDWEFFNALIVFDPSWDVLNRLCALSFPDSLIKCWNPGGILTKQSNLLSCFSFTDSLILNAVEYDNVSNFAPLGEIFQGQLRRTPPLSLIVTRGALGSELYHLNGKQLIEAFTMDAVDPLGAGDAFTAGYACMQMLGQSLPVCLRFGNLLGGLSTRKKGARQALPEFCELEPWMGRILE